MVSDLICATFGRLTWATNSLEDRFAITPAMASLFSCAGRSRPGERKAQSDHTARPFDQDSQLQNNLNRWYDASVGRWLSEDPIGFAAGDGNLYRYASAPLVTTDPLGLQENKPNPLAVYGVPAGWVGWELTLAGRTLIRIGDEQFYVSGKPQPGMWVPRSGSTSSLFIYRKGHPNDVFRLDYHPLAHTAGRPVWHYNTTRKLAKVTGLTRGSFGSTNHAVTIGSRATGQLITIFKYGGAALFVVGGGMSAYEVYKADNRAREATRQVGGLAGAILGARIGSWTGIKVGAGAAAIAGQAGPQVGTPEELVTVPLFSTIGGIVGGIGGAVWGGLVGTKVTETVYDWIFTPLDKEEWIICEEIR